MKIAELRLALKQLDAIKDKRDEVAELMESIQTPPNADFSHVMVGGIWMKCPADIMLQLVQSAYAQAELDYRDECRKLGVDHEPFITKE